jgi:hypothetical protein
LNALRRARKSSSSDRGRKKYVERKKAFKVDGIDWNEKEIV